MFNPVASIFNAVGARYGGDGVAIAYAASTRVRNAGTFRAARIGGTLSGSAIFGQVGTVTVPVFLVRESDTSYGIRLYAPQQPLAASANDGRFLLSTTGGTEIDTTVAGTTLDLGGATGSLVFDTPVVGVAASSGSVAGNLITRGGVLGLISTTGAPFALGLRNESGAARAPLAGRTAR